MNLDRRAFIRLTFAQCVSIPAAYFMIGNDLGDRIVSEARGESAEKRIFDLRIHNRRVTGAASVIRVRQEERVELRWTTDEATTIHLHGYDIEKPVKPGAPAVMTFEAHATGRFAISTHGFGDHSHTKDHAHGEKSEETILLYLEVHPR